MKKTLFVIAILTASVGCAESETQTRSTPLESAQPPSSVPAIDPGVEREQKKAIAAKKPQGPTAQPVDTDEVAGFQTVSVAPLPDTERQKLAQIAVPVLLPVDETLLKSAFVTHNQNWYAASMKGDGFGVYIRGTRHAFEVPAMDIPEAARAAADNYILTRTHQIVTVSWRSFNVSYSLDVECAKPTEDPRCTEDEFALGLAESLGVASPADQAGGER